ncbi:MAG: hypothetical protein SAK29_06090 [Scytonema sp. PMC 1069.18]|nr:hypothetical protein [Scytonema sp. PMC 1069.18]MEC4883978.1 hypothetical protein [Scytonema sp. PMC 1070.18]
MLASCYLIPGIITCFVANDVVYSHVASVKSITINKAEFGVLRSDRNGKLTFIPTTKVLLNEGDRYGWRIQLKDYEGAVAWREVIKLPKSPETWSVNSGEDFSISDDGKEATTKRIQFAQRGIIENFWTIAPGDPTGKYIIEVYVDNRRVASFDFEVVAKKKSKPTPSRSHLPARSPASN